MDLHVSRAKIFVQFLKKLLRLFFRVAQRINMSVAFYFEAQTHRHGRGGREVLRESDVERGHGCRAREPGERGSEGFHFELCVEPRHKASAHEYLVVQES